jgi:transposase
MLKVENDYAIPEETRRVVKKAFPKGNRYIRLRDELGPLFRDEDFAKLYPDRGQPGWSPWRLALVTVMQYMENLTDRQAANAVRARMDWKYALGLSLEDAGFDYSVLSEFRQRLLKGEKEELLLERILKAAEEKGLLEGKQTQRTDATWAVAHIRRMNRLEMVGETVRRVLDDVAQVAPDWLREHMQPEWGERYGRRVEMYRLPKSKAGQAELATAIGKDGYALLDAILRGEDTPPGLSELWSVEVLRRIWVQQYYRAEERVTWRSKEKEGLPPAALMIGSPDDVEARYAGKRGFYWTGYKCHYTETCDPDQPRLVTHVETTPATTHDAQVIPTIQRDLQARGRAPQRQLADAGYATLETLQTSRDNGIDLLAPLLEDRSWQAREQTGYDHTHFQLDWEKRTATCPQNKTSASARDGQGRNGLPVMTFRFSPEDCQPCPARSLCTRATKGGRQVTVYAEPLYTLLQELRARQDTDAFRTAYSKRAGVEGTISQAVRTANLHRARYWGLARTHLQHVATAAALNLTRLADWLTGSRPVVNRPAPFAQLALTPT